MSKFNRNISVIICTGLMAGCAGIPVAKDNTAVFISHRETKVKFPSQCVSGTCVGAYSDTGGDPRIPEADLSVSVPNFAGSLDFVRIYDSQDFDSGGFGQSWSHSFESRITMRQAASMFMGGYGGAGEIVGQLCHVIARSNRYC